VMRVGETTCGEGGRRSEDDGDGTLDSITRRGSTGGARLDSLEGDYDVVGVVGDRYTESMDLDDSILRVIRD
jgi:hypothetical protein